ncbi:MAG: nickel pincer cofactor biosynthesis protein LarB [Lachnospiraceae bacterium]|nr:nickel pincer cofactor biosynthesis protein LarB [Lachnospiraceae bacterium]
MEQRELRQMLEGVRNGDIDVEEAVKALKMAPFEDIGYAKIDHHRAIRQGAAEVIYGAGKTPEQIAGIARVMRERGQKRILITRMSTEAAAVLYRDIYETNGLKSQTEESGIGDQELPASDRKDATELLVSFSYDPLSRVGIVGEMPEPDGIGTVVVATGGTSDIPVAEEAAKTAEILGSRVVRMFDVGVAGIHRLMAHREEIMTAEVIVAVAGMEGALASVIGGLADCPVIAVPTSVGYGASFGGISALLSMLNSCASGVSVVNIDNGFGAGYLASMINHRRI